MFKSLKEVLLSIGIAFAETNYVRLVAAFAVIIPLVLAMYGFLDTAIFNTKDALKDIESYKYESFPVGSYALAYMGVAKFDVAITTIFGYIATAIVWSFTTDLQPALVAGKRK
ncbi:MULTISPECIES: hypothetical protein [unclassified Acinetobacter]|uniref:hypothetical protein n=1 Tax=unclassified Acinetobacter TaxID=196816 RepID=UPI001F4A9374|nr:MULTISPECIES: hypothetical protein [unclassified Acinetobacter]MCH7352244.1 hypothetical protein [Acinetobacter sp. NIPH 2023]MCH7358211.1 hypothetical protein [Acinetobacter sp. NIPH 2024]